MKDERLSFMMNPWDGTDDPFAEVLGQLLGDSDPVRIVDLSGVPNEIAGTARRSDRANALLVEDGKQFPSEASPVLLVCEEAHRYVPNSGAAQYEAAQEAIRRIAKRDANMASG